MTAGNGRNSDGDARSRDERVSGGDRSGGARSGCARSSGDSGVAFRVGREELGIRHRYETASIVNDFMLGSWFLVGSILFLAGPMTAGTWLVLLAAGNRSSGR